MSESISIPPSSNSGETKPATKASERLFWAVRVVLDTLLVCGGAILTYALGSITLGLSWRDPNDLKFLWAPAILVCSFLIVIVTCRLINSSTRKLTTALLAVILLSLASLNFLLAWFNPQFLLEAWEIQVTLGVSAAWALICMGLILFESRLGGKLPASIDRNSLFSIPKTIYRLVLCLLVGFATTCALATPFLYGPMAIEQCASAWWPVTTSTLVENNEDEAEWLEYSYSVDGVDYIGTREVSFFGDKPRVSTIGYGHRQLEQLQKQDTIQVSYNPTSPQKSLLKPGISNLMLFSFWSGTTILFYLPVGCGVLRRTYSRSLNKRPSTFEIIALGVAIAGLGMKISWGLLAGLPFCFDSAGLLLVVAIGFVYWFGKQHLEKVNSELSFRNRFVGGRSSG